MNKTLVNVLSYHAHQEYGPSPLSIFADIKIPISFPIYKPSPLSSTCTVWHVLDSGIYQMAFIKHKEQQTRPSSQRNARTGKVLLNKVDIILLSLKGNHKARKDVMTCNLLVWPLKPGGALLKFYPKLSHTRRSGATSHDNKSYHKMELIDIGW